MKDRIIRFTKNNPYLIAIMLLGLVLRIYKPGQLFLYGHDHDLAGWIIKDVVVNKHLRLIGQETSTLGIFIGPLFYYSLIPFYLIFGMDPISGVILVTLLGLFSIWSVYYIFAKVFDKNVGLVGALLYAVSFYTVFNDREIVPTMPQITWTIWFYYAIHLLLAGKQKAGFIIVGILLGLIWHINASLILLIPLVLVSLVLARKKIDFKGAFYGVAIATITSLPLLIFEIRHGFNQLKALLLSFTTDQYGVAQGTDKLLRAIHLASKNVAGFIWGPLPTVSHEASSVILVVVFILLVAKKVISKNQAIIMSLWLLSFIVFFSLYSKVLSEYYLNGMMLVWILIISVGVSYLLKKRNFRNWGKYALILFVVINLHRFVTLDVNKSGYLERTALVAEIKADAKAHGYSCVAVSYITKPGYDLGYRYLFWHKDMHVNQPKSGSPVYTIVFPHSMVGKIDQSFGALGLIKPAHETYTPEDVSVSCSGENSNITDPMFGYTE